MVTMQMSIENALSVVHLTLFRLHTRPRRPYKARFVLQFFCIGVASNLHAVFSQCPRALPVVVSCTWYSTLMFHPSCNNSDLLHSGMRKYSLVEVHCRNGKYAAYVCPLYVLPQVTCSQGLAASMRLFVLLCWGTTPLSHVPCLVSYQQSAFDCVHIPRRVFALATCGVSCIRFDVCRKRTDFFSLAAEAFALRLAALSTTDELERWERRKDTGYRYPRTISLLRDTAAAINLWNDFCFRWF